VHSDDPNDYSNIPSVHELDHNFEVHEDSFKQLPPESLVILDDFQIQSKKTKPNFSRVLNVTLRHHKITLILIVHNFVGNLLFNEIVHARHLFLSCSNIGLSVLSHKQIYMRLGGKDVIDFYQQQPKFNFQFMYVNSITHYLIYNCQQIFDRKLKDVTMYTNGQRFIIHLSNTTCGTSKTKDEPIQNISSDVDNLVTILYPKQKSLFLVTKLLLKHNTINQDLYFLDEPSVHLADFLRFLNNRFDKNIKPNVHILKLCKIFQSKSIRLPNACIKNPLAKKYLC
jgi:hypothetical protein